MKLNNIKVSSTSMESAPFDGINLHSSFKGRYKGGTTFDLDEIITSDIKGVMFSGDWYKRPLDFVECLKKIQEHKLQVFIDTKTSLETFKLELGIASFEKTKGYKLDRKKMLLADEPMLVFIGAVMIDYYLSHTKYWVYSREKNGGKLSTFELAKEEDVIDSEDN